DNAHIHRLNKQFLQHDEPTDVLTFPYTLPGAKTLEGEVAIGYEVAKENAADRGHDVNLELLLYVVHGCLHLCGYYDIDDASATDALVVVYCHHGVRSISGAAILAQAGFPNVASLVGGIDYWSLAVDPAVPRY